MAYPEEGKNKGPATDTGSLENGELTNLNGE